MASLRLIVASTLLLSAAVLGSCAHTPPLLAERDRPAPTIGRWALAIHGGAGTLDATRPESEKQAHRESLSKALEHGRDRLVRGDAAIDVVESVVRILEDDPKFNAGHGAAYTADGRHELDASIMDGRTLATGAVAGVTTVRNPISLARLVMKQSGHVLLARDGAEQFADAMGVERVPNSTFDTPQRLEQLRKKLESQRKSSRSADEDDPSRFGTVGCVALDMQGNLAAATSTGGMTGKRYGRVGDSPIVGAGTYADNRSVAVSCTGTGEEFIRHTAARSIAALVEFRGLSPRDAAAFVLRHRLSPDDGGLVLVSRCGEIVMDFTTEGMYRGAADNTGRFEVRIFKDD